MRQRIRSDTSYGMNLRHAIINHLMNFVVNFLNTKWDILRETNFDCLPACFFTKLISFSELNSFVQDGGTEESIAEEHLLQDEDAANDETTEIVGGAS
jgi:hypothetical protein